MALTQIPAGIMLDLPAVSPAPYWRWGYNVRSRMGLMETLGLFGPLRTAAGAHITLPGTDKYRSIKAVPSPSQGQIIAASANKVMALQYDPGSIPGTGTRWLPHDITPAALPVVTDVVSDPGVGRIEIPPVWWVAEQEDIVVIGRSNDAGTGVFVWDRVATSVATAISGAPQGAVAGAIIGRILVLMGCQSFTDPDPERFMTIRWSDRFDFSEWTPSDINISGEMQLEGGSRIMGGGVVGKGILAWTDTRMALLTETGDPDSVFARRYVDGARGLMANRAWCEADGQVWWFDETRNLNVWDGGAPTQIENPLRLGTIERVRDATIARAYMVANPEYSEVILWLGMADPNIPDTGLVYNYADKTWYPWRLSRTAWSSRVGSIRNLGIDELNRVWQHDLDSGMASPWLPAGLPPVTGYDPLSDVAEYSWHLETCLVTTDNPEQQAYHVTRYLCDHLPSPATSHDTDTFDITVTGYGEATLDSATYTDTQTIAMGQPQADFRVGGKGVVVTVAGEGATVWRFGKTTSITQPDGER
jgi:hypothetical protein